MSERRAQSSTIRPSDLLRWVLNRQRSYLLRDHALLAGLPIDPRDKTFDSFEVVHAASHFAYQLTLLLATQGWAEVMDVLSRSVLRRVSPLSNLTDRTVQGWSLGTSTPARWDYAVPALCQWYRISPDLLLAGIDRPRTESVDSTSRHWRTMLKGEADGAIARYLTAAGVPTARQQVDRWRRLGELPRRGVEVIPLLAHRWSVSCASLLGPEREGD